MKKPKITEGEWVLQEDSISSDWGLNYEVMSKKGNMKTGVSPTIFKREDAKAMSAVPEMIDALIESTKLFEELKPMVNEEYKYEIEQQIEMNKYSALRKAGVEL